MRIGILDFDTKREPDNFGRFRKYPNIACGKIYGWHKQKGDEIFYPWDQSVKVDILYVSIIFNTTARVIKNRLPFWEQYVSKKIYIGGSGWDDYRIAPYDITELPFYINNQPPKWTYELYDIDYGIEFTFRGCHVGCAHCNVPKKEGLIENRVNTIEQIINPRGRHIILMNNNSFAHEGFFEDIEQIKHFNLSVHWDQANDITLLEPRHVEAIRSVDFRGTTGVNKQLFFAFDQMIKKKVEPDTERSISYDMMKVVPEKVRMMKEMGISPSYLTFYMLVGFDTSEEDDIARVECLRSLGCDIHPMLYMDIKGRGKVDGYGNPQSPHSSSVRDWVKSYKYRTISLQEFKKYQKRMKKTNQMDILDFGVR